MKTFDKMTPQDRISQLKRRGVKLFPSLTDEQKKGVLYNG
jgi:hypothetical protein